MVTRYDRQIQHWGKAKQKLLEKAKVTIVGTGGVGSSCAETLCRAGVGKIIVFDDDVISISNLNRQVLYTEKDIGKNKVNVLKRELKKINSSVLVEVHNEKLSLKNKNLILETDLIIDCTDKLKSKLELNKIALSLNKKLIYSSAVNRDVRLYVVEKDKACLECFLGDKKVNQTKGIINTTAHTTACLVADVAFKIIMKEQYPQEFMIFNLNNFSLLKLKPKKKKNCVCLK